MWSFHCVNVKGEDEPLICRYGELRDVQERVERNSARLLHAKPERLVPRRDGRTNNAAKGLTKDRFLQFGYSII